MPTVEANTSLLEITVNGKIVANASIPYLGIGLLEQPVYIEVKNGYITKIEGGSQADVFRKDLEVKKIKMLLILKKLDLVLIQNVR